MKRKISFLFLLIVPFCVRADDYIVTYSRYEAGSAPLSNVEVRYTDITLDEAFEFACQYMAPRLRYPNALVQFADGQIGGCVSNVTTGAFYSSQQNPRCLFYQAFIQRIAAIGKSKGWTLDQLLGGFAAIQNPTGYYKFTLFRPRVYCEMFFSQLTFNELVDFAYTLQTVPTDVSSLVPLVESNRNVNASIASTVAGLGGVTNQLQNVLNNRLFGYTVDYDIPQIRDAVGGFRLLDPQQPTGDNTALMTYYYALRGLDFMDDQPGMVAQMVQDGFASSTADATAKLVSNTFRASTLGPAVSQMRAKRDAIAKLKAAGMSAPPGGGSFDDMNLGELETLYQYSYNTPVSSNATVQAHALDELKQINSEVTDAAGILSDIRNEVTGPQEVEVLNWPDDFNGLSVTLSNAFAEALANLDLNVSSDVWQLGRDYEEYRTYSAGINPSYDSFFTDAQFLAAPGPNDGKWWTESQNLLAYIAYYTASNRSLSAGIYAELSTNGEWVAASLAAASNNLAAIWGDNPRGWLDSKLEQLTQGQSQLLDGFNSLTYFDGVGDIIDTYYQDVQQLPDNISFNTPLQAQFSIDLRRMRGFLDLLHAATTLFLIGGWLCCVPYIARWMFEHVNKMFDLFKR